MNEIGNFVKLNDSTKTLSTLEDCFGTKHFVRMCITVYGEKEIIKPPKRILIRILFKNGNTSGEQEIQCDTMIEAFEKIIAFQKELEDRANNKTD